MVPIGAINGKEETLSSMSRFLKFLIRIKFIPIRIEGEKKPKATFRLFSFSMLIYIICYWVILPMAQWFSQCILFQEITEAWTEMLANANIIDYISMVGCNFISVIMWPLCPLLLAQALPSAPYLTMNRDLKWPKNGLAFVLSFFLISLGNWFSASCLISEATYGKNLKTSTIISGSILPFSFMFILACLWMVPSLIFSAWMDKFILLCNKKSFLNMKIFEHTKFCLSLYLDIGSGFGFFFLHVFDVTQCMSIVSLFIVISWPMSPEGFILSRVFYSSGVLCMSIGLILNIVTLTFKLDAGYQAMRSMAKPLQEYLVAVPGEDSLNQEIKNLINDIRDTGSFSGMGLFSITRDTLTGMLSIAITYIIILVQFKMSFG